MKNKDLIAMEKAKYVTKMNEAIKNEDSEAFTQVFVEMCQMIENNVLEEAREMAGCQDTFILAQRGIRQLTSEETEYYQKVIDAMRSADPKQALNDIDVVMPETIIDAVFDDLTTDHPLLSKIKPITVNGLTRLFLNTNGEQKAAWGKLTAKIIEELTSGFKEVDMTQDKLSAFLPISKPMLDLGPAWLDRYIRTILSEALANGLEYAIVDGSGKDMPIGMMRQVGEGVTVVSGEYPAKKAVKILHMDMYEMGNITSMLAKNENGQPRTVKDLIMVVNPVDYWRKFLPATRILTPDGNYASVLPVPAEAIQSAAVPEGKVVYGIASRYLLGVGMAKNGKIEFSDHYRFLEDERVYLIKSYANGFAMDNNAFMVLDISELQPARFRIVPVEETAALDATLADLKIGALTLDPTFTAETDSYTATTENETNTITATPASASAEVKVTVGDKKVSNGAAFKWQEGANTVKIDVTDGTESKSYTVTVTKSSGD